MLADKAARSQSQGEEFTGRPPAEEKTVAVDICSQSKLRLSPAGLTSTQAVLLLAAFGFHRKHDWNSSS